MRNQSAKYYSTCSFEVKNEVKDKLTSTAKAKGISRTKLINMAIAEYFENHKTL